MASLVDLLSARLAPIQSSILSHLLPGDVIALTRTCSSLGRLWTTFVTTQYNINKLLRRFFKDPLEFRSVQSRCHVIIVDRFARYFFTRVLPEHFSLTLSVPAQYEHTVQTYLESEGYRAEGEPSCRTIYSHPGTKVDIWVFTESGDPDLSVRLLLRFSTTAKLNFITWNKAYCLFPLATLIKRNCYPTDDFYEDIAEDLEELALEGLQPKCCPSTESSILPHHDASITDVRRIGDRYTLTMELDTEGVQTSEMPDGVIESATFQLYLQDQDNIESIDPDAPVCYEVICDLFYGPILKYDYTIWVDLTGNCCEPYYQLCKQLKKRLDELIMIELLKLPSSERPPEYHQFKAGTIYAEDLIDLRGLPATWKFYDEEVIEFLLQAWNHQQNLDEVAPPAELKAK